MKREWKKAEVTELEVQATEQAETPVTGVDQEWMGEDGRKIFIFGVKYNSGSSTSLTLTGEAAEVGKEIFN